MSHEENSEHCQQHPRLSTDGGGRKMTVFDKSLMTTANLVRLLPTGTTLVFQTLAPSFTNHGTCYPVNRVFSWGLIVFLFSACAFLSFTDSIIDPDGKTYYGLALPKGFYVFNYKEKRAKQGTKGKDDVTKNNEDAQSKEKRGKQGTKGKDDVTKNNEDAQSKEKRCCLFSGQSKNRDFIEACEDRGVKPLDFVHALFSALVFLALTFDDAELQTCLLGSRMTEQWKEFLVNMPLAIGLLASFVFIIFPSTRKGIGYDVDADSDHHHDKKNSDPAVALQNDKNAPQSSGTPSVQEVVRQVVIYENGEDGQQQAQPSRKLFDKSLSTAANLVRLLPDGTTLAFQTLAPSFTNHGRCYPINRVFSWGLIGFLFLVCAFLCFTDSIIDPNGNTYYGLALPNGFYVFNYDDKEKDDARKRKTQDKGKNDKKDMDPFTKARMDRKMKPRDFVHALFSALVFLALACDDAEVQSCLLGSRMTEQWKEFFVNMPLAIGFLASFVFMIFPSTRKGIGYDVDADSAHQDEPAASAHDDKKNSDPAVAPHSNKNAPQSSGPPSAGQTGALTNNSRQITVAGVRVAPSTSYELDSVV